MNKAFLIGLGAVSMAVAGAANAAIITLASVTPGSGNTNIFSYQGTLGPDEGVRSGDMLVIYDFAGFVEGSLFVSSPNITATTEFTTPGLITPGQTDDASLVNLVFTYTGPDFRNEDGPFQPFNFNGFGAASIYSQTRLDAFRTWTTKNNPEDAENTLVVTLGTSSVPSVPEPQAWALMIIGFGLVGVSARRRQRGGVAA